MPTFFHHLTDTTPFAEWSVCVVDEEMWARCKTRLPKTPKEPQPLLESAFSAVKRAAALDTGAIEDLYDVDRGFTFSVAFQMEQWNAALVGKGQHVRALFESQLRAYDLVLDFATQQTPIAAAWIRQLHAEICSAQDTYLVYTEGGPQRQELPRGEYKHLPNHVLLPDDTIHSYAPVEATPIEVQRLCDEIRSEQFAQSNPVLQASYVHYALVAIHPFADGNGRVARALASAYTFRSLSVPLLIFADQRKEYFASLRAADAGNRQAFVDIVLARIYDAVELVEESLRSGAVRDWADLQRSLEGLYIPKERYSHERLDQAARAFLQILHDELHEVIREHQVQNVKVTVGLGGGQVPSAGYRLPVSTDEWKAVQLRAESKAPATGQLMWIFGVEIPRDCNANGEIRLKSLSTSDVITARASELLPDIAATVRMRLKMAADRLVRQALEHLGAEAEKALRGRGYP